MNRCLNCSNPIRSGRFCSENCNQTWGMPEHTVVYYGGLGDDRSFGTESPRVPVGRHDMDVLQEEATRASEQAEERRNEVVTPG